MAEQAGVPQQPAHYFATGLRRGQLHRELREQRAAGGSNGTVGAVAVDESGGLAAATSTGGMTAKPPGRVGDTPVIGALANLRGASLRHGGLMARCWLPGAGTYANNATCAISGTGNGELFLSHAVASTISAFVEAGLPLAQAAKKVIDKLPVGSGGVIAVDREGNWAAPFNSDVLFRGWTDERGGVRLAVGPGDPARL